MGTALAIRTDIEAEELRRLARLEGDGRIACRLLALANVLDGLSREAAARQAGAGSPRAADHAAGGIYAMIVLIYSAPSARPRAAAWPSACPK
jgi:hypothetical protein